MNTRQELIELLQTVLADCRTCERSPLTQDNDHAGCFKAMAYSVQEAIDFLKEPDPKVIQLLRAINNLSDQLKPIEKTLHVMAANLNRARTQLVQDANYNETVDQWVEANLKGKTNTKGDEQ